jgi:class 3 adenylate cyclase/tetratricopeptide (TPR) repeat protein
MICSNCQFENGAEAIYCSFCGMSLAHDGVRYPADTRGFHGERRQMTALFCDVVGSTEIAAALDPEEYHDVIRAFAGRCREVVERYGAYVAEFHGDGALIFFGYPRAYGDEAERAIRAGLAIVAAFAERPIADNRKLDVRIGIATGVMAITPGVARGPAIVGDAVNLAARLQSLSEAGSVLVSETTKRLAGSFFDFVDLGPLPIKGFAAPLRAWRVAKARETANRFDALRRAALAGFVGRRAEIDLIAERWKRAASGEGQVVIVSGESGIGKSRLIKEARTALGGRILTMRYFCSPYHTTTALYPLIEYLSRAAEFEPHDTAAERRAKLERALADVGQVDETRLRWLLNLLASPDEEERDPVPPQQRKHQTLRAALWSLTEWAKKTPFIIVLEDAQWIDPTSSELMEMLVEHVRTLPILVIISARPPFRRNWMDEPHVSAIGLERLDRGDVSSLVAETARGSDISADWIDKIVDRSDGIPLFAEELTKMLVEADPAGYKSAKPPSARSPATGELPTTLRDLLTARLDQFAPAKQVAQVAAVIGREFSYDVLAAVAGRPGEAVRIDIDQLTDAGLIAAFGGTLPGQFRFRHVMVRDAAYEGLLKRDRRDLHAKVAAALERKYAEQHDLVPELIAHHFTQAGLTEQALTYWAAAARRALSRSANAEAIEHTEQALEILAALPQTRERDRQELGFRFLAGGAYWAYKGYGSEEVEETFSRALELAAEIGDPAQTIYAVRGLFGCYYVRAEHERAQKLAERVLKLASESQDRADLMIGHMMLGSILYWRGEFRTARHELETAIALYDPAAQRAKMLSMQIDPGANAHMHLAVASWMLGFPDKALQASSHAVALARQMNQPFALAQALLNQSFVYWWRGDVTAARAVVAELREVTTEYEIKYLAATVPFLEGGLSIAEGEAEAGLQHVRQAATAFQAQQASLGKPLIMAIMATGYLRSGAADDALNLVAAGISAAEATSEHQWLPELYRLKGECLALQHNRLADAEACAREALQIAAQQGALSLELRAATSLCRIMRTRREATEGADILASVLSRLQEGLETADAREARALLDEIALVPPLRAEKLTRAGQQAV